MSRKDSGCEYFSKASGQSSQDDVIVDVYFNEKDHTESSSNNFALYDHGTNAMALVNESATNTSLCGTSSDLIFLGQDHSTRVLPSVGTFTVQCARCMKWRLVPTKMKYEEIRENIVEKPFYCETAREWKFDVSCTDPPDIVPDDSKIWAIDKPNIAQPPPGWERILRIRGEGSTRFADVYYSAPSGKMLRSMVEIQRYLLKHPEYASPDVNMSKFSFQIPRPLQENYVRKRSARFIGADNHVDMGVSRLVDPTKVDPLGWTHPSLDTNMENKEADKTVFNSMQPISPSPSELAFAKKTVTKKATTLSDQGHHGSACNVVVNIDDSPWSSNSSETLFPCSESPQSEGREFVNPPVEQLHDLQCAVNVEQSPAPLPRKKKKKKTVKLSLKQIYGRSTCDSFKPIKMDGLPRPFCG